MQFRTVFPAPTAADAGPAPEIAGYRAGDLSVDLGRAVATRDGVEIPLPRLTFDLLVALARAAPNIATTDELMRQVWAKVVVNVETVAQRVKLLRGALGDDSQEPRYIAGVRGRGYRLVCPVEPIYAAPVRRPGHPGRAYTRSSMVAGALALLGVLVAGWLGWSRLRHTPAAFDPARPLPPRSIAVLPFRDLNEDPQDDILALGIPDALLHQLASLENLEVIARTSSFSFKGHDEDIRNIGQQLGARYILEGTVQRDQGRLRVTAQLADAQTGAHLWSLQFDKTLRNVFELQDAIAIEVARALSLSLQPAAGQGQQRTQSFEAYLEYLQGSTLLDTWRTADVQAAAGHAARAIAMDPQYADAYVLLAQAKVRVAEYDTAPDHERRFREVLHMAQGLLDHALALDSRASHAYAERGYVNAFSDLAAAESDLRKALELDPSDVQALEELAAVVYQNPARGSEALALIDRALKLDPLESRLEVIKATYLYYGRSDSEGAEKLLQDALRRSPMSELALSRLAEVYWTGGRFAEAIRVAEQVVALDPSAAQQRQILQSLYIDVGDLRAAQQLAHSVPDPNPVQLAELYEATGDWRAAGQQAYRALALGLVTPVAEPVTISALRMEARGSGQYRRAANVLAERSQTEWDAAGQPIVHDPSTLYLNVVGLADMLIQSGQAQRGRRLLAATLAAMQHEATDFGRGTLWQHHMRPVALALLGRDDEALADLRDSVVDHYNLTGWRYRLEHEPAFARLRPDPRFQAILRAARERAAGERAALAQLRAANLVPDRSGGTT
ncbi:MAG: winged helix-turn-helix domain-containing protein [Gammaproteobacteria bacterium]|nr:winged helix-turn-helix domain-containing protein [Gammaproteobacteria bacterium]